MAAPKENLYALGNNGGKPRIFATPEDLEAKVAEFFQEAIDNKWTLTITRLALYLGFNSRNMLYEYRDRENFQEYSGIIKRAMLCVEMSYEEALHTFKYGGAVFALKNMGWADKSEVDNKVSIVKAEVTHVPGVINDIAASESDIKLD